MKSKQPTPSRNYEAARDQVRPNTPDLIVELIARQLDRADDAKERIEREGSVVRDLKGSVVAHPSIAIELAATKAAADLIAKHKSHR